MFEKDGRFPLYTEPRLDDWARTQLSPPVSSTAELAAIRAGGRIAATVEQWDADPDTPNTKAMPPGHDGG